jgi:hypothetical protein
LDFDPEWVAKANARLRDVADRMTPTTDEEALGLCAMWGRKVNTPSEVEI